MQGKECGKKSKKKERELSEGVGVQLVTQRVPPSATGHLWLPRVFFVEKKRPHSSQRNSQTFPCLATSCRSRSCCRENLSEQPSVQGNVTRGFGLCASMCTLRVYWLVKRRVQPRIRQGNLLRSSFSPSLVAGEGSLEMEGFRSSPSRLEQEGEGDAEVDGGCALDQEELPV